MSSSFIKLPVVSGSGPSAGVDSFNGRTGVVVSQAGDYSGAIVANTPAGNIAATNVQGAINELDSEKQAVITGAASTVTTANLTVDRAVISNGSGKIDVSAVTSTELANLSGSTSNIQTQLNAKQPLDAELTAIAALVTNGLVAKTGAGTAAVRSIVGSSSVTVSNGDGVSGDPSLDLSNSGATAGTYSNPNVTVDAKGRVTAISSSTAPAFDPDLTLEIKDDFTGSTPALGAYGFLITASGTGAGATTVSTGIDLTLRSSGVMQISTGTTTTGRTTVSTGLASFMTGLCSIDSRSRLWLADAGTVAEQFEFTFGLLDNTGASLNHTDGAYFRFNGNGTNVNWQIVTAAAGVLTTTTTSSPVLVNNAQIFQIIINEAGTLAQFYIDGVLVGSHNTNVPTTGQFFGWGWKMIKAAGTTARLALVDWGYLCLNYSSPRG